MRKKLNKNCVRLLSVISGLTFFTMDAKASIFGGGIKEILSEVKSNYITVLSICTVIFILFNIGNFFGENADYKKGIRNLIIYAAAVGVSSAIIFWVGAQNIS